MAFDIKDLRKPAEGAEYVSDERLCVTEDGEVVSEDDPRAVRLLVGKGAAIPADEARKYGLVADDRPAARKEPGAASEPDAETESEAPPEKPKRGAKGS